MYMQTSGFREPLGKPGTNRRRHKRVDVACNVRLATDEVLCDAAMIDVSEGGARLRVPRAVADTLPLRFIMLLSKMGRARRACEVVWRRETEFGVRFVRAREHGASAPVLTNEAAPN